MALSATSPARKARTNDTSRVEVDILHGPAKITTGQLSVALFQDRPAGDKVLVEMTPYDLTKGRITYRFK